MSSWQEQVAEAHAEVVNDIKGKFKQFSGGPSVFEGIKAFCAAVNWSVGFKWIPGPSFSEAQKWTWFSRSASQPTWPLTAHSNTISIIHCRRNGSSVCLPSN